MLKKTQTIEWGALSQKHIDYIKRGTQSEINVAEGAIRSGKTLSNILLFQIYLETCPDKIHLASGSTLPNAKLNIGVCNGFGLENLFRGRCRWGKYKDNEALYIQTKTGEKVVIFTGGGKADSYKKILGNSYGGWIATEINEHYDSDDSRVSFIKVAMGRQIAAKQPFILWDMNPCNPNHSIYKNYVDAYAETYGDKYNYQHFTLFDNATMTQTMIDAVMKKYTKGTMWYRRDIDGERCIAQGLIYQQFADNPEQFIVDDEWLDAHPIWYGIIGVDFGGNKSASAFNFTGFTRGYKYIVTIREYYYKEYDNKSGKQMTPGEQEQRFCDFVREVQSRYKCYEAFCDSEAQTMIIGFKSAVMKAHIPIEIRNARKGEINDRIALYVSLQAQGRYKIHNSCVHTSEGFSQAVWDDKKKTEDVRKDDGTTNIDSLDAQEYSTESVSKDILYLGGS